MLNGHRQILIIIALFLSANIIFLHFYSDVWWDAAVYLGMGKYIFSNGKSGLWESSRPLVFPFFLGFGKLLNLNMVYLGRFISLVFSALVIFMTYTIGLKLFSRKAGILAAFFTAFSLTFLFFSSNMLTEIPSTFFVLIAFYFFLEEKFFLMGLFSGIAVMTRFFQLVTFAGLGVIFLLHYWKKPKFIQKSFSIIFGASITIIPFLILNYHLYGEFLLPFKEQAHLTATTGWMLYRENWFYLAGLLKENFFIILLLAAPFFMKKNYKFYALILMPLFYLIIFSLIKHKEMRFMIVILPFLYLLVSYAILQIYSSTKNKKLAIVIFALMAAIWIVDTFSALKNDASYFIQKNDEALTYFQDYLKTPNGNIWVTNPSYALYSSSKINGLLYYLSPENLVKFVSENENNVDSVLYNSCDMECPPAEIDPLCLGSREFMEKIFTGFSKIYEKRQGSCRYAIYRKII